MQHIDDHDSVLVVIDAQPGFYGPDRPDADAVAHTSALERAAWVTAVASAMSIPIVVTEEDPARNGSTSAAIGTSLPPGTPVLTKTVFGADGQPDIDSTVRAAGRGTVVLVGTETDVCVAQSALGWHAAGLRAVVVHDAVYSAGRGHENGIRRLRDEGIELVSAKELYYEWLRTLPRVRELEAAHPALADPPGFSL